MLGLGDSYPYVSTGIEDYEVTKVPVVVYCTAAAAVR